MQVKVRHGTYVIFLLIRYVYSTSTLFFRTLTVRWPHYMTKINYVQVTNKKFIKVSTECVIDSRKRQQ